jgi:hypothetical protein
MDVVMQTTIEKILATKGMFVGGVGAQLKLIPRDARRNPTLTVTLRAMETRNGRQADGSFGGSWLHVQRNDNQEMFRLPKGAEIRIELVSPGDGQRLPNTNEYWDIRRKNQKSGKVLREFTTEAVRESNKNTEIVVNRSLQAQMDKFRTENDALFSQMFEQLGSEFRKVMTVAVHTARKVDDTNVAIKALVKELGLSEQDFEKIVANYKAA